MSRAKRKKPYKTKREKLMQHVRNIKLILIFGSIALAIFIFMRWQAISDWFLLNF